MKTKLQLLREHLNLTQMALQKATGISQSSISLYEHGVRNLGITTIRKLIRMIAKRYQIDLSADDFITNIYVDKEFTDYLKNNIENIT